MKQLTQTRGNCWQTCIAMILGEEPVDIPEQPASEEVDVFVRYVDDMRVYLWKHHGLTYVEIDPARSPTPPGFHIIMGETVRDAERTLHAVVGHAGRLYWDVHPSRAGLTRALRWGMLISFTLAPAAWRAEFEKKMPTCTCRRCQSSVITSASASSNATEAGPSS